MPAYIEKVEKFTLPVIILKGTVAFPSVPLNFEITEPENRAAADAANKGNGLVFIVPAREFLGELDPEKLYEVGVVAKIKQSVSDSDDKLRVIAEGLSRASVISVARNVDYFVGDVISKYVTLPDGGGLRGEAFVREARAAFEHIMTFFPSMNSDISLAVKSIDDPGVIADFIASNVMVRFEDKIKILESFDPIKRIELLIFLLKKEAELLECELEIHKKVHARLSAAQRERYLREQLDTIREELGDGDEEYEYQERIYEAKLPREIEEKLIKEAHRMGKSPFGSAEAGVLRNYLDVCLELPWKRSTADRVDIAAARKILEADHDGLEKVKERILEFLAVKKLQPDLKNQIICLVGPPGTGKTSIAQSIAKAMRRKYVRVSLGGVRDEADIRGHRKTYVGAMPGRIINALVDAKVKNPLMLLDEIDKLGRDGHGDPTSAMLEVLDPEQNKNFRDHFVELPFDLSECLFICTANTLDTVPRPLIDRMEIIELKSYTRREKLSIAKNHLLPKQAKRHGLNGRTFKLTDDALIEVIDNYTRESGVRNLEREIASLCRKAAMKLVDGGLKKVTIDAKDIESYLGARKVIPDKLSEKNEIGEVNGLAYTEVGGDVLKIEVAVLDGTGKLELTGSLGDVMKESAKIAVSYIRSIAARFDIPADFYKTKDIHIHFPEGAVPKDGPSAGIAMVTAVVSALSGKAVHRDIAMTGEVTLRGKVLAIGGLREKTMAAYKAGIKRVLIPHDNKQNLEDIDPEARANLEFIPVKTALEVLEIALCRELPETDLSAKKKPAPVAELDGREKTTISKGEIYGA